MKKLILIFFTLIIFGCEQKSTQNILPGIITEVTKEDRGIKGISYYLEVKDRNNRTFIVQTTEIFSIGDTLKVVRRK